MNSDNAVELTDEQRRDLRPGDWVRSDVFDAVEVLGKPFQRVDYTKPYSGEWLVPLRGWEIGFPLSRITAIVSKAAAASRVPAADPRDAEIAALRAALAKLLAAAEPFVDYLTHLDDNHDPDDRHVGYYHSPGIKCGDFRAIRAAVAETKGVMQ